MSPELNALVAEYLALDQNLTTRAEINRLVDADNERELSARLKSRLEFGTAGLRAEMAAGYSRMNNLTVIQASQGLAACMLESTKGACQQSGVVIGHDHRKNQYGNSFDFARVAAAVFLSKGIKVYWFADLVHTPLVPFGVLHYGAAAGIMVTASHNPKNDNGYKVYWSNGCQIIPPHDELIAKHISQNLVPWDGVWNTKLIDCHPLVVDAALSIQVYFSKLSALCRYPLDNENSSPITYTAMHGVGYPYLKLGFTSFNLPAPVPVLLQVNPDPLFPTVEFPNPEEGKGALKLAMEAAEAAGSTLILANDPDADRLAVAELGPSGWKVFNGNEIGIMLGYSEWQEWKKINPRKDASKVVLLASTVSSKMLQRISQVEGFTFMETLTGFKWLGNKAIELAQQGYEVLFAYEEAIGFMCGTVVMDKDGVSAAAKFAELRHQLKLNGLTCLQYLEGLFDKYGYFVSKNSYFICHDQEKTQKIFERIRYTAAPKPSDNAKFPFKIAYLTYYKTHKVSSVRDLTIGYDSSTPTNEPTLPVSAAQMITLRIDLGKYSGEVTLRTSGTEPKIKYYIECCGASKAEAETVTNAVAKWVREDVLCWKEWGIESRKGDDV